MGYRYPRIPIGSNKRVKLNQVPNEMLMKIFYNQINLKDFEFNNNPLPDMEKVRRHTRELLIKRGVFKEEKDGG